MSLWEYNFVKNKSKQKPYFLKLKSMIADISAKLFKVNAMKFIYKVKGTTSNKISDLLP